MKSLCVRNLALVGMVLLDSFIAQAFVPTPTDRGNRIKFRSASQKLNLVGNPRNQDGLAANQVFQEVVKGLQRWKKASRSQIEFDYWQGEDKQTYFANSVFNHRSSLYFASQLDDGPLWVDPSTVGMTQVWFDTQNGDILEVDIVLNDRDFDLTLNPQHTTGTGSSLKLDRGNGKEIYLGNILTHELGHAFGLAHSSELQSSMLFVESPEQAHLSCDDISSIRTLYPGAEAGVITGRVFAPSGAPLYGAVVSAVSIRRGVVLGTALTDSAGEYKLDGLEPGTYLLLIEPFTGGKSALPPQYSQIETQVCSGRNFARTFFGEDGNPIVVSTWTPAPPITVACTSQGGAAVESPPPSALRELEFFENPVGEKMLAEVGRFDGTSRRLYRLNSAGGKLELRALAYSLYSPVNVEIQVKDLLGNPITPDVSENVVYRGGSGFENYDAIWSANALPEGDYLIELSAVTPSPRQTVFFPAGAYAMDRVPFFVLTGGRDLRDPVQLQHFPFNARCALDENFPSYESPAGGPPQDSTLGGEREEHSIFSFCASIHPTKRSDEVLISSLPHSEVNPWAKFSWALLFGVLGLIYGGFRLSTELPPVVMK